MTQLPGRAHTAHRQLARSALFSTSPTATTVCGLADLVGGHRLEARERRVEGVDLAETQFGAAESAHAGVAVLERERGRPRVLPELQESTAPRGRDDVDRSLSVPPPHYFP